MSNEVLIYETSASGHRGYYVRVLADELLRLGFDVALAIPQQEIDSPAGVQSLQPLLGRVSLATVPKLATRTVWGQANRALAQAVEIVQRRRPHHLFIPLADGMTQAWGAKLLPTKLFPCGTSVEGLMMRGGSSAYPLETAKQYLLGQFSFRATVRSGWDRLHYLDPISFQWLQANTKVTFSSRLRLLPEAIEPLSVDCRRQAAEHLGLGQIEGQFITCPGTVNERKGCDLLIQAFQRAELPSNTRLLLVGKHSPQINAMLAGPFRELIANRRIISIDHLATLSEFDSLFAIADLVAVPYPRETGSSSILIRAAHAGKQVLACDRGWVGWAAQQFDLGGTCNVLDLGDFAAALATELHPKPSSNSDKRARFVNYHSLSNHLAHWVDGICDKHGVSSGRKKIPFPFDCAGGD